MTYSTDNACKYDWDEQVEGRKEKGVKAKYDWTKCMELGSS